MPPEIMRKLLRIYQDLLAEELGWREALRRVEERIDQGRGQDYPGPWWPDTGPDAPPPTLPK